MLSNSRRRAPAPPPIHIPEARHRRNGEDRLQIVTPQITPPPPTRSLSKTNPTISSVYQSTTTLSTQRFTSLRPSFPTSRTAIVPSATTRLSTSTTTTTSRSPTKTSFVTIIQTQTLSNFSPKDKDEKTPKASTVFVSVPGAPQFVTVTAGPTGSTGTALPLAGTAQNATSGANLLPPGAIAPLVILSVIAGLSAIITVIVVLYRRRKKRLDQEAGSQQQTMTEAGDNGFRAIPDTQPILPRII